jgi:membrane-anchored protein YejM (alkaline phosphatase superfamily)
MSHAPDATAGVSRGTLARALALTWLANVAAGTWIGTAYFGDRLEGAPALARVFAAGALVSSIATLFAVVLVLLWVLVLARAGERLIGVLQSALWTLALLLVFADTRVYEIFRYHLNGMVWNVITTPGGQDMVQLGAGTWVLLALAAVGVLALEHLSWRWLVRPSPSRLRARVLRAGAAIVLCIVVLEKGIYAVADARGVRQVTARAGLFPLYQRFTMKRSLERWFGWQVQETQTVEVAGEGLLLRYPLRAPVLDPEGARPNILIVVIDSLRADMLAPDTMPSLSRWSHAEARVFADHLSGGNATRFGIFSLVYGIHGTYWMPVYEERTPPVLVTALAAAGYDLRVISAARMTYPEFRSTAWVTMQDAVEDDLPGDKVARDRAVVSRFAEWMDRRAAAGSTAPFFCFTLLDAPHQTYAWPPEETVFQPSVTSLDYLELSSRPSEATVEKVENSYRNAVRFADASAAAMIEALRSRGLLESTLVVVTGDHGEELYENGFFGHTSNFTPQQVHVAFAMSGPGVVRGVETRPTCHVDVPTTLLEILGADPATRGDWSQGESLLAPPDERDRVIAGWQEVAVWVDGGILHVPLEGHKGTVTARDARWRPLADESAFITARGDAMADLARACRRFLR